MRGAGCGANATYPDRFPEGLLTIATMVCSSAEDTRRSRGIIPPAHHPPRRLRPPPMRSLASRHVAARSEGHGTAAPASATDLSACVMCRPHRPADERTQAPRHSGAPADRHAPAPRPPAAVVPLRAIGIVAQRHRRERTRHRGRRHHRVGYRTGGQVRAQEIERLLDKGKRGGIVQVAGVYATPSPASKGDDQLKNPDFTRPHIAAPCNTSCDLSQRKMVAATWSKAVDPGSHIVV